MENGKFVNNLTRIVAASLMVCAFSSPLYAKNRSKSEDKPLDLTLTTSKIYDKYQWSAMYYWGKTVNGAFVGTAIGNFKNWPEHIHTFELMYTLHRKNFLRRLVNPLVDVVQIAGNITKRRGDNEHIIYEFDPYIAFRWANWPWNHYLPTSFAFAEGISYVTSVPSIEKRQNTNTKRLMNYLMYEVSFGLPSNPRWQFILRVHHRSGAYGLYGAGNTGSNAIGAGVRYLF